VQVGGGPVCREAAPSHPEGASTRAPGRQILSHGWVGGKFDALGDECRELLRLGLREVQVKGDPSLLLVRPMENRPVPAPKVGTASTRAATELLFVSFTMPAM
jgi:hypothetical protein